MCYTGGNSSGKKWIEPIVLSKSSGNPIFGQIFGHQRAKNEARNTKMYLGQETHPIRKNARYEMNWVNSFLSKSSRNPIFGQIFGHRRAENEARNTKINRGQETHPIRINTRHEMNWANRFFKKFRKPCLQTDGRTDRHRDESSIPHSTFGGAGVYKPKSGPPYRRRVVHPQSQIRSNFRACRCMFVSACQASET